VNPTDAASPYTTHGDRIDTRVSRLLGVRYPIVQAPMGRIARAQLASAVSNAGGLGIIETSSGELAGPLPAGSVTLVGIATAPAEARLVGAEVALATTVVGADLRIELPAGIADSAAHVLALRW
jgi:NAD(P)H-dependent flavin oxidoreductase YrpB (nitropropane dioxygenase family)